MTLAELKAMKTALRNALAQYERITPCCHSCEHYRAGRCEQFDGQTPPPEWVRGPVECEQWMHCEIPF